MKGSSSRKDISTVSTASTSKPVAKASEVTRFFEKAGVLDALTRVFITMYEEKEEWPANGPAHFLNLLTPGLSAQEEIDTLGEHIYQLRSRVAELMDKNEEIRERLQAHELRSEYKQLNIPAEESPEETDLETDLEGTGQFSQEEE